MMQTSKIFWIMSSQVRLLTYDVKLVLGLLLQVIQAELVFLQLLEYFNDRAQQEEQLLMLYEDLDFLVK